MKHIYNNNQKSIIMQSAESKQQVKLFNEAQKAQKEVALSQLKYEARNKALSTAQYIRSNDTAEKVLKDADKIYKWLLNGQK